MSEPETISIDLADGSSVTVQVHLESGKLHVNTGWFGAFVLEPASIQKVAQRVLELTEVDEA